MLVRNRESIHFRGYIHFRQTLPGLLYLGIPIPQSFHVHFHYLFVSPHHIKSDEHNLIVSPGVELEGKTLITSKPATAYDSEPVPSTPFHKPFSKVHLANDLSFAFRSCKHFLRRLPNEILRLFFSFHTRGTCIADPNVIDFTAQMQVGCFNHLVIFSTQVSSFMLGRDILLNPLFHISQ
jgi:hypothetical protein